jgi:fermentation-respiration switch protein FrsA (DUF1100 family)|mmetsp:Transcript_1221/g.2094  ORF Transcript_1221/g.2094 Transcript_1221/m.2094 type:complete len:262 (-) Transcript_1221:146-931(-)|eukprot:CAMPEP_0169089522 /NCGR_PEP_ID=MMETSP1015-20121227/15329_1 /TAXON_ID=342587 /ORGANISM="Karlodinium micrum, Strain CCMP2283" /LENGTH=261 /DNA_ID=CAMNT_0009149863 /DNA_START=56 /DNA_END=841 /DNA_ORIENTATION=+
MGSNLSRVVFQPPEPSYTKDPNLIWLNTDQSEVIPAFYVPHKDAHFTLLFSHANAEDLGYINRHFREVSKQLKVNVFAYEYSGYGMSSGQATEKNVYADIEAAFKYLRDIIGVPWTQIILYGRSVGCGPSCHLASRAAVRGVVLQTPCMSIYRIPFHFRFSLPGDLFSNIDKIDKMHAPVYIIHGTRDEIVPCWHGQTLYEAFRKKGSAFEPYWVEGADHNNLEDHAGDDAFYGHFSRFLEHLKEAPISDELQLQAETSGI